MVRRGALVHAGTISGTCSAGNDNAGENVDPEDEPGNQLASWDIRWASPIGDWNYAHL